MMDPNMAAMAGMVDPSMGGGAPPQGGGGPSDQELLLLILQLIASGQLAGPGVDQIAALVGGGAPGGAMGGAPMGPGAPAGGAPAPMAY
jgi:hypothetical protein